MHASSSASTTQPPALAEDSPDLKLREYRLSVITAAGATIAFLIGLRQYQRAEQWKRTEFLACEMKQFFADPTIRNALTMIDWAPRPINLYLKDSTDPRDYPLVKRSTQISALLPHTELAQRGIDATDADGNVVPYIHAEGNQSEGAASRQTAVVSAGTDGAECTSARSAMAIGKSEPAKPRLKTSFTLDEAQIRDAFDRLLDQLERFSTYEEDDLVKLSELKPHLSYWIKDIAAETEDVDDAAWTCALFTYIETYNYTGVQQLFAKFDLDITTRGAPFRKMSALAGVKETMAKAKIVYDSASPSDPRENLSTRDTIPSPNS